MATNMKRLTHKKNGNRARLTLVPPDRDPAARREPVPIHSPLIWKLDRRLHTAFVSLPGKVASRGVQDIRDHQQFPGRVLGRRLIEIHMKGATLADGLSILRAVEEWLCEDLYGEQRDHGRAA